jgi:hypothetical protein
MARSSALAFAILLGTAAAAWPQAAGDLPFGLSGLHWGMAETDAIARFSALAPPMQAPRDAPMTDQTGRYFGPYAWQSCSLEIWAWFAQGKLDRIALESRGRDMACRAQAYAEVEAFRAQADGARLDPQGRGFLHVGFVKDNTSAVLNDFRVAGSPRFEMGLSQRDGPGLTIFN